MTSLKDAVTSLSNLSIMLSADGVKDSSVMLITSFGFDLD
jgi:hypothetical protein